MDKMLFLYIRPGKENRYEFVAVDCKLALLGRDSPEGAGQEQRVWTGDRWFDLLQPFYGILDESLGRPFQWYGLQRGAFKLIDEETGGSAGEVADIFKASLSPYRKITDLTNKLESAENRERDRRK